MPRKFTCLCTKDDSDLFTFDSIFGVVCDANDVDHAREQTTNTHPNCNIVWIVETDDLETALADYFSLA
jgi:hypothetical protein